MAPIALAFAVLELDGSATDLGLVLTAAMLPRIALILVGGVVADRLSRSTVLIGSNLVSGTAQLAGSALLLSGRAEIWMLAVLAVVAAASSSFFFPASQGVIPQTVESGELQPANALLRLALNTTNIAGAAVGGLVVGAAGAGWAYGFDGVTYLASAVIFLELRLPAASATDGSGFLSQLRDGWDEFRSRRWLWVVVIGFGFANAASAAAFGVLGPIVARDSLGGAAVWGIVLAGQGVGLVAGSLVALRVRPKRPLLIGVGVMVLTAPPLVLLAVAAPVPVLLVSAFLAGAAIDLFSVLWDLSMQGHVPLDRLSRVYAWDALGSWVLMPIGFAIVGPVSAVIGVDATLWLAAAVVLLSMLGQLAVRDVRRLGRPAVASDA
jgi:predicted MFS family arabinose efflux permease